MKVLIVSDLYTVTTNGVVTSTKNLAKALSDRGHEVRILTLSDTHQSHREENVSYIKAFSLEWVYPGIRGSLSKHDSLIKELIDWKPDVVHSQCEYFTFPYARHIAKRVGAPLVHTYHTQYEDYVNYVIPGKKFGRFIVSKFIHFRLKHTDAIISPSTKTQRSLISYGLGDKVTVLPSGISLEQHLSPLAPEERKALRESFGVGDDTFLLMTLGRLGKEKSLDKLLRDYKVLLEHNADTKFLIVGDGPDRAELEAIVKEEGIGEHVIFAGAVPPKEVHRYYKAGDIFVSASNSETQGLVFVEAAANSLPLVCRKDPCLDGVLNNGVNGFEYTDTEGFVLAVEKLKRDRKFRESASEASRRYAQPYDRRIFGESVEKIYGKVIEEKRS